MSDRGRGRGRRGRGRGRGARVVSEASRHMPEMDAPASPVTEAGSHDRMREDDTLSQAMLQVLERVAGARTGSATRGSISERLRSNRAEVFRGISGVASNVAEYCLKAVERIMDDLDCTAEQKLKGVVSLLERRRISGGSLFGKALRLIELPGISLRRHSRENIYRRKEFLNLTVVAYEVEFLRLSRYARGIVQTDYEHCVRFEDGLRDELRVLIALQKERNFSTLVEKAKIAEEVKHLQRQNRKKIGAGARETLGTQVLLERPRNEKPARVRVPTTTNQLQTCVDCGKLHRGECWRRTGGCYRCGSKDHRFKDCPRQPAQTQGIRNDVAQQAKGAQQPPRGRGPGRGGNGVGRGQGTLGRGTGNRGNAEVRQPGLVYAVQRREDGDAPDVITSTFFIFDVPVTALIDIGSTHSYVACAVSGNLNIRSEIAARETTIISPLVQSVIVNKLFRDVSLEI
ncbi:ATP-dependent zinc metalloprotease FtsH [Gossypium australe]|uniref:ATP-dependent zinc metalloprotease FtsH n=1 Tax=Gossypium australe TaxID=47621 RepID=A0A5B6V918_9ROSI|nr:ATP-dependent zinc metalloprotease FtsH [Gossypium australe]